MRFPNDAHRFFSPTWKLHYRNICAAMQYRTDKSDNRDLEGSNPFHNVLMNHIVAESWCGGDEEVNVEIYHAPRQGLNLVMVTHISNSGNDNLDVYHQSSIVKRVLEFLHQDCLYISIFLRAIMELFWRFELQVLSSIFTLNPQKILPLCIALFIFAYDHIQHFPPVLIDWELWWSWRNLLSMNKNMLIVASDLCTLHIWWNCLF